MGRDEREVYPNAPVVLVALEVRHPVAEPLSRAQRNLIKQRLVDYTPIMRLHQQQLLTFLQVGAAPSVQDARVEEFPRYFSRDSTVAVSVRSDALVIETTRYGQWERLRAIAAEAFDARQELGPVDGLERVGLRYIDEIRVPDLEGGWEPWVHRALLGASVVGETVGLSPILWQGVSAFSNGPEFGVVLRYGPRDGFAVDPGGELKRSASTPGPFFLIDIDSSWTPGGGVPEFDTKVLLSICDDLRNPVRDLFERLVTERLREEVLRHVP